MLQPTNPQIEIAWNKFEVGTSFFIPCLDRDAVQSYILEECRRLNMKVLAKQVVSRGMYGVRVWRVG